MARCIFCDEWAGRGSDQHEACRREFERQMRQPTISRRAATLLLRVVAAVIAVFVGAMVRTR